jgi:hypothetical protein
MVNPYQTKTGPGLLKESDRLQGVKRSKIPIESGPQVPMKSGGRSSFLGKKVTLALDGEGREWVIKLNYLSFGF